MLCLVFDPFISFDSSGCSLGTDLNATALRKARKTNQVIPAQAGIHTMCHMAPCYGFPLARE
jgi:hypothetical protein